MCRLGGFLRGRDGADASRLSLIEQVISGSTMIPRGLPKIFSLCIHALRLLALCWFSIPTAQAVTYANASVPIAWIDPISGGHTRVGYNTGTYFFSNTGGCGTSGTTLDDTLSNAITLGFNFWFGGVSYSSLQISTNGRLQFGNNTCGYGTQSVGPPQTYPYVYPSTNMNQTMKIFGADLDPTDLVDRPNYPSSTAKTNCMRSGTGGNSCGIYIATLGTAPYRKFVVTWYNVPEWVSTSNTSGSFTMQAILHENGEFVFQYLSLNHGGSGQAEVGWQVDMQDYDVLRFPGGSEPDNNTAMKFYIPQPMAEYRMEQASWPAGSSVLDTSGNARHASPFSAGASTLPTTTPSGKVCRGASIPANTSASDISAIATPFSMQTVGSQGSFTFWYQHPDNGERMLLDASGVSATPGASRWFYVMKTTSRRLKFVIYDDAGTRYEALTSSNALSSSGSWDHIGVSWNFNGKPGSNQDRLLLWINGSLVKTQAFTTSAPMSAAIGTLHIGDNRSPLGVENNAGDPAPNGPRGTGSSAGGTIDELRIYNVEGGKGLIDRDRNQASACLSHYAITHAGAGSTCQPTQITITAHDMGHSPLLMPNNTTSIQIGTSSGRGDWAIINGYGVLNNGLADDGVATYLFNGEYQVVLGLTHGQAGTVSVNVTDGQLAESPAEDPNLVISLCSGISGFNACDKVVAPALRCTPPLTADPANLAYARLKTKLAGDDFAFDLVALKADGTLEPAFAGKVNIDLVANSTNDIATNAGTRCPDSQTAIIPVASNVGFGSAALPSADTPGYGQVNVPATTIASVVPGNPGYRAYRDVRVRFTCNSTYCPPSGMVRCSSDNFAIRPKDVSITPVAPLVQNNNSYAGATGYKQVAGSDFSLVATAVSGYNGVLSVDVGANLVTSCWGNSSGCPAPLPTTALRTVSSTNVTFSAASVASGSTGNSIFQYHDAGTFRFEKFAVSDQLYTAVDKPNDCIENSSSNDRLADDGVSPDPNGKVGCTLANQSQLGPFGRFYPDRFAYVSGSLTQGLQNFSYFGRPNDFSLTYTMEARSLGNPSATDSVITKRYNASTPSLVASNAAEATDLLALGRVAWVGGGGAWTNGQYIFTSGNSLIRPAQPFNNGPYDQLYFGVDLAETGLDGRSTSTLKNFRLGGPNCTTGCTHRQINADAAVARFGRLRLLSVYGTVPPLLMPVEAQYWNGRSWARNDRDATPLTSVVLSYDTAGWPLPSLPVLVAGRASLSISPASVGVRTLTADLSTLPWLQANWNGAPAYDQNPSATAAFGIYGGSPQQQRLIHVRELY